MNIWQKFYRWLDERLGVKSMSDTLFYPVPKWVNWLYCFGGLTLTVFLFQVLSGTYLTMFFHSAPVGAWESIEFIEKNVWMGHFSRSVHRWGAFLMIFFLIIHTLRVIYNGAYRAPRELNWITGILLLLLTVAFVLTGYLLPWDFRAYWIALTVWNWIEGLPMFAGVLKWLLFTDTWEGVVPVGRWFAIHVLVLPALTVLFLIGHFFMIRRHGISKPM